MRSVAEAEDHGAYRYRRTMDNNFRLVNVYHRHENYGNPTEIGISPEIPGDDGDNGMHSQLRERIRLMRARLDNAAPLLKSGLNLSFVTPAPVCDRW